MAFASTRIGAQEAIIQPCDLCEDDEDVNWFCKDCDQSLCDRCKRSHLRSNVSKSHIVLSISEGFEMGKKNISNICVDHGAPFQFICRTCDRDICPSCLSMEHKKHDFVEIRKLQSEMEKRLDRVVKVKEDELKKMTNDLDDLVKEVNESETYLNEQFSYIDDQVNVIKIAADNEGQKLKDHLKANVTQRDQEVKECQHKIQTKSKVYENEIQTVKRELRLQNPSSLKGFVEASISKLQSLRPASITVSCRDHLFSGGLFDQNRICEMIGRTETISKSESTRETEELKYDVVSDLEVIKSLEVNQVVCNCMCLSPDGSIWIGGNKMINNLSSDCSSILCNIRVVSLFTSLLQLSKGLSESVTFESVTFISCLQSGEVVACRAERVYIYNSHEGIREFTSLFPKKAYEITVMSDDRVAINVDREFIAIFTKGGHHVKDINVDGGLSTFCSDNDGNVIIAHSISSNLSLLDGKNGIVKSKWSISTPDIMLLACDRYGNILASNKKNNVYFISKNGNIEKTFTLDCDNIRGICLNQDDHLMILLTKGERNKILLMKYFR